MSSPPSGPVGGPPALLAPGLGPPRRVEPFGKRRRHGYAVNRRRDGLHACRCTLGTDRSQCGLRRKPDYAANASASGACLFLTVSMPPLPGYRKAKPRGGSPMHGPIWLHPIKIGRSSFTVIGDGNVASDHST